MSAPDLSSMHPGDGAVALRTLPRRYRDAARTAATTDLADEPDDQAIDEVAARVGPDGWSAADLVVAASARAEALERWLRSALVSDTAIAPRDLLGAELAVDHDPSAPPFARAVDELAERLARLAKVVDDADAARWIATLPTDSTDSPTVTPLEVLQRGVASLVGGERRLGPLLRSVRGRPG